VDISALLQTFATLNECASALQTTGATVTYLVDGVGHARLIKALTAFSENSEARRTRLGRQTERLAAAYQRTATEFLLTDEELAGAASRAGEGSRRG
jgi:hypothetical protein